MKYVNCFIKKNWLYLWFYYNFEPFCKINIYLFLTFGVVASVFSATVLLSTSLTLLLSSPGAPIGSFSISYPVKVTFSPFLRGSEDLNLLESWSANELAACPAALFATEPGFEPETCGLVWGTVLDPRGFWPGTFTVTYCRGISFPNNQKNIYY